MSEIKNKKDTGYKTLKRTSDYNLAKWGEYMKRAQIAEKNIIELKEHFLDLLAQGCATFNHEKAINEYDHLCISTYENALRYGIQKGWINESQLLRSL